MAEAGRSRASRLLCSPYKQSGASCVPTRSDRSLATHASAAQPERRLHVGPHGEAGERLAPQAACPSSLALGALRRRAPKVGAECPNRARSDLSGGRPAMAVPTAKPPTTRRKFLRRHQNWSRPLAPGRAWREPAYWPRDARCIGGVTLIRAFVRNLRTWPTMPRENAQAVDPLG